jgi:hypothetical protein
LCVGLGYGSSSPDKIIASLHSGEKLEVFKQVILYLMFLYLMFTATNPFPLK